MTLTLRSPAFESGGPIPARFDHERGDLSPALAWDGVPDGTAALVLLVDDPDAPVSGSFVHWVLCNLDPARQGIAEGEGYGLTRQPPSAGPGPVQSRLMMIGWPVRVPCSIRSASGVLTTPPSSRRGAGGR